MNRISMVTRRDIRDLIIGGKNEEQFWGEPVHHKYFFWGRLNPVEFLKRLYPLHEMPTLDSRCKNAEADIHLHTVVNPDDYADGWVFDDKRFQLMGGDDAKLLDFICAIFHPEVRDENGEWKWLFNEINVLLRADSYVLCRSGMMSGRDVYGWRDMKLPRFKKLPDEAVSVFDEMFYSGGYVLGFDRRADFEEFTYSVIGVGLCERYQGLSMGKSFRAFLEEGTEDEKRLFLQMIETLKVNDSIMMQSFEVKEGKTSPPKRYTSGTIILAMENAGNLIEDEELRAQIKTTGIGTAATRQGILEKLDTNQYICINKKTQVITPENFGEMIYEVVKMTSPSLLNPEMTASWERGLEGITNKSVSFSEYDIPPPGFVGYSQSRSIPSMPHFLMKARQSLANFFRPSSVLAIAEKPPSCQLSGLDTV